jgi:hypothetical protein
MRLKRESDILHFTFNWMEAHILLEVLRQLAESYRLKPDEIDPRAAEAWYSKRGCVSATMSEEETREWLAHLHAFKGEHLPRLEAWSKQIRDCGSDSAAQLRIKIDDAAAFMTAINDHRLLAAARHDIGQREMDIQSPVELARLPGERQLAMLEIHFLAVILEETLRALQES